MRVKRQVSIFTLLGSGEDACSGVLNPLQVSHSAPLFVFHIWFSAKAVTEITVGVLNHILNFLVPIYKVSLL